MPSFNEISVQQLMRQVGSVDAPLLVDVCIDADFAEDPRLIPSSVRIPFDRILDSVADNVNRPVVVICQKGKKLSHGAASLLRSNGIAAEVLAGGIHAWRDAGLPMVRTAALPSDAGGATLWVTRHRPKIDRVACPWLIRRFVDPKARFLFVPTAEVEAVAEKFSAIPFDIEDTFWSHRGQNCTFDTMIEEFQLSHPALDRLAMVVRAADTDRHDLAPQAAGLLAISVGLSRLHKEDQDQLDAALPLYDALYRWARDGYEEGHDWPAGAAR